jgi:5-methylcytosine-specific restriction endonuclease McrA
MSRPRILDLVNLAKVRFSGKPYRTTRRIPKDTPCGYCFDRWATTWDHLLPVSYRLDNSLPNLHPACRRCNNLLSNTMFEKVEEKREYVRTKLTEQGKWAVIERFDIEGNLVTETV